MQCKEHANGKWLWRSWQSGRFDSRGPGFESSHRQLLLNIYLLLTVYRKDENKEKRAGMALFLKKDSYSLDN